MTIAAEASFEFFFFASWLVIASTTISVTGDYFCIEESLRFEIVINWHAEK